MDKRKNDKILDVISDFALPLFVFWIPFFNFGRYNDVEFLRPEFGLLLAALAALASVFTALMLVGNRLLRALVTAGLLTLFADLAFDVRGRYLPIVFLAGLGLPYLLGRAHNRALAAAFAATFVATLVLPVGGGQQETAAASAPRDQDGEPATDLPVLVHVILDEHIGVEGIPPDIDGARRLKSDLKDFYASHGFRLFGMAYSHYAWTINAVPNALNLTAHEINRFYIEDEDTKGLTQNKYFDLLNKAGYKLHATHFGHPDYCVNQGAYISSCWHHGHYAHQTMQNSSLSVTDKMWLILNGIIVNSHIDDIFLIYREDVYPILTRIGVPTPFIGDWFEANTLPIISLGAIDEMADAISRSPRGHAYFLHLGVPHAPFIFDGECDLRPVKHWRIEPISGAPAPWRDSYRAYLGQVRCVHAKLGDLFRRMKERGVYRDAVILVHGDHGSRISQRARQLKMSARERDDLTPRDYIDAFSTFFAIKAPGYEPGYDTSTLPLELLLADFLDRGAQKDAGSHEPYVLLEVGAGEPMVRAPLPDFRAASQTAASSLPARRP